jgi:hypothetical protein
MSLSVPLFGVFLFLLVLFSAAYNNSASPHHNHDASNHNYMIQNILRNENKLKEIPKDIGEEFYYSYQHYWYPLGFHYNAVFICLLTNDRQCILPPWKISWVFASLSVVVIYLLAKIYTKNEKVAFYSSLVLASFYPFPFMPFGWGGWTQATGLTILGLALFLLRSFLNQPTRLQLIALALTSISLFYTHTTDFLSYLILALSLNIDFFFRKDFKEFFKSRVRPVLVYLGIVALFIFPGYLAGWQSPRFESPSDLVFFAPGALNFLTYHFFDYNHNTLLFFIFSLGIFLLLFSPTTIRKAYEPLVFAFFVVCILAAGLRYSYLFNHQIFGSFFPWGQPERIIYLSYLVIPIIAGFSYSQIIAILKKYQFALPIFALIVLVLYARVITYTFNYLRRLNISYASLTANDLQAFKYINKHLSEFKSGYFFIDPLNSGGAWLDELTEAKSYFPLITNTISENGWRFLKVFANTKGHPTNPTKVCQILRHYDIRFVFVGDRFLPGAEQFIPKKLDQYKCLEMKKRFQGATIYKVKSLN